MFKIFGIDGLNDKTIKEIKESGGKINLFFKGEKIIAEIIIGGTK